MGGPVAGKTFVVGRLFGLHREFLGFSHRKQVVDDPIRFCTVAGEIEGHAYAGKVGDIRIDFAHVFIGSFPFFIPLRHLDFEPAGALGARGYHGADTGGAQGILQHFGGNASCALCSGKIKAGQMSVFINRASRRQENMGAAHVKLGAYIKPEKLPVFIAFRICSMLTAQILIIKKVEHTKSRLFQRRNAGASDNTGNGDIKLCISDMDMQGATAQAGPGIRCGLEAKIQCQSFSGKNSVCRTDGIIHIKRSFSCNELPAAVIVRCSHECGGSVLVHPHREKFSCK